MLSLELPSRPPYTRVSAVMGRTVLQSNKSSLENTNIRELYTVLMKRHMCIIEYYSLFYLSRSQTTK